MNEKEITLEDCKQMATKRRGCKECHYFMNDEKCHLRKDTKDLISTAIKKIMECIYG